MKTGLWMGEASPGTVLGEAEEKYILPYLTVTEVWQHTSPLCVQTQTRRTAVGKGEADGEGQMAGEIVQGSLFGKLW